jgi:3-dehydroquinate synthase
MKKVRVNLGERSYPVIIGRNVLPKLKGMLKELNPGKVAVVITNSTINHLYGRGLRKALKGAASEVYFEEVPDSEKSKSESECIRLIEKIAGLDKGKGVFIIAFGGGVIGDLAGFVASIYKRGVPYIQVPTTLLAQVDSSIGGKVAIDLPCGKNLIGSFYQPRLVLSDVEFLGSLSSKQLSSALAEIIKYAVISDPQLFQFLEKNLEQIMKLKKEKLRYVIEACSRIKAGIVEQDETDAKDKRIILNFGHTTAHALEAACAYSSDCPHGYAVALGMLVACRMARDLKLISAENERRIEALIARAGLPVKISGLVLEAILSAQAFDKKFRGGKNRFILPRRIGRVVVKENISRKIIVKALKSRMLGETSSLGDYE